jgi:flagellar motor switch protein FliN/FliY
MAHYQRHGERMSVLETIENARLVLDQWANGLADVLASMTDHRPDVSWCPGDGPPAAVSDEETLWWEQPFQAGPEVVVWVAAPRALWEYVGTVTLKAAGLETVDQAEARNTWLEILGQSLGLMARSLGVVFGREIACDPGVERPADSGASNWASVTVRFPDAELPPLAIVIAPRLLSLLASPPAVEREHRETESHACPAPPAPEALTAPSRTMALLLDVDLPVSISFGKTQLPLKDVLKLTTGSIVELNRGVNDQVEVLVNQCLIARGEVVVVEGNYGVRIQEIASRQDRLRSLR